MTTNSTKDESLEKSKKTAIIVIIAFATIVAAWFITINITKNSPYFQK